MLTFLHRPCACTAVDDVSLSAGELVVRKTVAMAIYAASKVPHAKRIDQVRSDAICAARYFAAVAGVIFASFDSVGATSLGVAGVTRS